MIVEDEIIGSHTEDESHEDEHDSMKGVLELFGVEKEESEEKTDPPIDQKTEEKQEEKKGITVKFNKEETFIEEERVPELARKGLNYEKVEGRANEYQQALDRVAKLQGFNSHAELIANLDRIEQEKEQAAKKAHDNLRAELRQQAEDAGLDPDAVQAYLDNHPLVKQGEIAAQEREAERAERQREDAERQRQQKWDTLYEKYPHLIEDSQKFRNQETPDFYTPEMKRRVEAGYDPLDAFELAHRDTLKAQTKKATEQRVIKEQQLGLRSKVETSAAANNEKSVPAELANAFAAFGLPAESAKKYVK